MHARRPGPGHGFGWFPCFVTAAAAALALGVVAGCDSQGAIPIDDIPASVEAALCREAAVCGGGPDQAACESAYFVSQDNSLRALVAGVKRGTIVYDGHRARECWTMPAATASRTWAPHRPATRPFAARSRRAAPARSVRSA